MVEFGINEHILSSVSSFSYCIVSFFIVWSPLLISPLPLSAESGEGLRRVIHSSLLLQCNEFSFQRKTEDPARRPTQKRKITRPAVLSTPSPASETSSDEEA